MGWTYRAHAGLAGGLSTVLTVAALLTWVPGTVPTAPGWLTGVGYGLALPLFLVALARLAPLRADRYLAWQAFRCVPLPARAVLGTLPAAGTLTMAVDLARNETLTSPEARDGRYCARETAPGARGEVEIPEGRHQALREEERRGALAGAGLFAAGAAYAVLTAAGLRRADRAVADHGNGAAQGPATAGPAEPTPTP
ncbi:hypothetical protein VM636_22035 [Streptomyces sp. SCSIO 75703]|uniref:hypothetical protein n=1 Tax=unclassified Streptomyces TaxID=2593676 RepID=UPI000689209B|nr:MULTISPECIES: hypothetical protein [unclassified Streptomyces]